MSFLERAPRLAAVLIGLVPLLGFELCCRVVGAGDFRDRPDPFAGFSHLQPAFRLFAGSDGVATFVAEGQQARTRRFLAEKPENGFRAFVFGGSTEAGTPYGYDYAFAEFLRRMLADALPDREIEVVNCAVPGFASRRLLYLAQEVSRHEPDLFIVSTGHNEVIEQRLYKHLFDYPPWLFEIQQNLRRLRTYVLLEDAIRALRESTRPEVDSREVYVPLFGGRIASQFVRTPAEDVEAQRYYALSMFENNVDRILAIGREAGAELLVLSQSKNYADWPVTFSAHGARVPEVDGARFDALLEEAKALRAEGDARAAIEVLERAIALDDRYAEAHQMLGDLHRSLGELEAARASYRRAHNTTPADFGTTPARNEIARELAGRHGALWIDVDRLFEEASPDRLVGFNLFVDFLHPNIAGHQLVAKAIFARLREAGVPEDGARWREPRPLPPPEAMLAAEPGLRGQELRIRIVAEVLSDRRDLAETFLERLRALAPDDPQLARIERWVAGELPFSFDLLPPAH